MTQTARTNARHKIHAARLSLSDCVARARARCARLRWSRRRRWTPQRARTRERQLAPTAPEACARFFGGRLLAECPRSGQEVVAAQHHQLRSVELRQLRALQAGQPQRLRVERLLEERAREPRVPEAFTAGRPPEDSPQNLRRALVERVLVVCGELLGDRKQLVRRVVREGDLPREARA